MPISTEISAIAVNVLSVVLPMLGVTIGNDDLTKWIQVSVVILTGLYLWVKRYLRGGVTMAGIRK